MHEEVYSQLNDVIMKLRSMELIKGNQAWRMEQQLIETYALIIVKHGEGQLMIDDRSYRLRQETVHFGCPGQTLGASALSSDGLDIYVLMFDVWRISRTSDHTTDIEDCKLPFPGEIAWMADSSTIILCDTMYKQWRSNEALEQFRSQASFQELLYLIMNKMRHTPEQDSRTAIERTKLYIDHHYDENLTIDLLARMAEISPKYYGDLFKKTYGVSAIDYVTEVRVNQAKQLMVQSDTRLRDIAHQVGYHDEFYFSRKFKKEVGVSPTVYMRNRRRKIAAYSSPIIGQMLAIGVIPYAAPLHPKWTAYYHQAYRSDIPVHLSAYRYNQDWEANIEALRQAHPDAVISMDSLEEVERERLEKIAPVFYVPSIEKNWREHLLLTADFLGETDEAEGWLQRYDQKVNTARVDLKRILGTESVMVISIYKKNYFLCATRSMRDVLYHDLMLNPVRQHDRSTYNMQINAEQFAELDADRILINICQEPESIATWQQLQTTPIWRDLRAVRNNKVYLIPSDPWREYSANAHSRIIDEALKLFVGKSP
jgi:ABC-type Fe3+-hydroxamate transport system substrate-binding protein